MGLVLWETLEIDGVCVTLEGILISGGQHLLS